MEVFLGMIIQTGFNYAPSGFHQCDGSVLPISQYNALFALLGTQFGGNGTQNFQLPDLRGRVMVGSGQGPGLQAYISGEVGGTENTTLLLNNMPAHSHPVNVTTTKASLQSPAGGSVLAHSVDISPSPTSSPGIFCPAGTPTTTVLAPNTVGVAGGSQPVSTLQPFLGMTTSIALVGIFPSRN